MDGMSTKTEANSIEPATSLLLLIHHLEPSVFLPGYSQKAINSLDSFYLYLKTLEGNNILEGLLRR